MPTPLKVREAYLMSLEAKRKEWEDGYNTVLTVVHNEVMGGTVFPVVYSVIESDGLCNLIRYFKMHGKWQASVDLSSEPLQKCLDMITAAMVNILPKD